MSEQAQLPSYEDICRTGPPDTELDEPDAGEGYRYGPLPDYDSDCDKSLSEERPLHLLECCNTPRPRRKIPSIIVKPSPGNDFVTIHDYLSTIHPFLLALREDIPDIMYEWNQGHPTPETKLWIDHGGLTQLWVSFEVDLVWWKRNERRTSPSQVADED
ncbi:hypothetical protein F5X97DRAFT_322057 [Nemania serpens]|nr:hypothetical protein F5X97DRAFT_322057 [Nemania serpens]